MTGRWSKRVMHGAKLGAFQSGFSLLEAMIAGLIAAIGLAGTAALLLYGLAQTTAARDRTVAVQLALDLSETMLISAPAWRSAGLAIPEQDQFAVDELSTWRNRVTASLPRGTGIVCRDSTPMDGHAAQPACDGGQEWAIKVFWHPSHSTDQRREVLVVPL